MLRKRHACAGSAPLEVLGDWVASSTAGREITPVISPGYLKTNSDYITGKIPHVFMVEIHRTQMGGPFIVMLVFWGSPC